MEKISIFEGQFFGPPETLDSSKIDKILIFRPEELKKEGNEWEIFAKKFIANSADPKNWKRKNEDGELKSYQLSCLMAIWIASDSKIIMEYKIIGVAWILFEMLSEVPEYIPGKSKNI